MYKYKIGGNNRNKTKKSYKSSMRYINKFVTLYDASYLNVITIQINNIDIFKRYKTILIFESF